MTGSAKQSIARHNRWMDCFVAFAPRNDGFTIPNMQQRSRGADRPRFAGNFPPSSNRGRREDRVHAAPAVSRANRTENDAHEHTGSAEAPGLPCAMALRLITRSPWRPAFL